MPISIRNAFAVTFVAMLLASSPSVAATSDANELSVSAPQVQQYLDGAFPQEFDALGGLFTLTARDPALTIPDAGQRLTMAFSASASTSGGEDRPVGRVHMSSGLRYDPQAKALFLDGPTLDQVQPTGSGQRLDEQTRLLLNLWLADYARKEPLYRLDPDMLAQLGSLQVESTRIEGGKIVVRLNQPVALPDFGNTGD